MIFRFILLVFLGMFLTSCGSGTQYVKQGVTQEQGLQDTVACGGMVTSSGVTVPDGTQEKFDTCMASKNYTKKTRKIVVGQQQGNVNDPKVRKQISRNAPNVTVHESCEQLYLPMMNQKYLKGTRIKLWHLVFVNNSKNRYRVSYDVSYTTRRGEHYTDEKNLVIRAGKVMEPIVEHRTRIAHKIQKVDIFQCGR
jgi:hypothetical protein